MSNLFPAPSTASSDAGRRDTPAGAYLEVWAAPIALLLLATGLQLWDLGRLSLWVDEGFAHHASSKPLLDIFWFTAREENHPPLYYYLALHLWMAVAGSGPWV